MTDMLFEQPIELLADEQLVRLPIEDLLNACRSSPQFSELCKNPKIWIGRIQNEYPGFVIPQGVNPRDFYLRQKLFGGEIYLHYINYEEFIKMDGIVNFNLGLQAFDAKTQQVAPEIIAYTDLFVRVKEIAESMKPIDRDYLIVYSRVTNVPSFDIKLIAAQSSDNLIVSPGPHEKITLVDIIYLAPDTYKLRWLKVAKLLEEARINNQRDITVQQYITYRGKNSLQPQTYSVNQLEGFITSGLESLSQDLYQVIRFHKESNTEFYRRNRDYIDTLTL